MASAAAPTPPMGALKDILVNVGAIAGFASVVGLAVLAMLYFSQARDVRRLREWAGREPERAAEVELRAQQIASQAIAQAYQSMQLRQSEAAAAAGIAEEQGVDVSTPLVAEGATPPADAEVAPEGTEAAAEEHDAADLPPTEQHDVVAEEFGEDGVAAVAGEAVSGEDGAEHVEDSAEEPVEHHVAAAASAGSDTVVHPGPIEELQTPEEDRTSRLAPSTPAAARAAAPLPPLPPLDTSEFSAVGAPPQTPPIPDYYLTSETGSGHFDPIPPPETSRSRVPFAVAGVLVAVFAVILIATQIGGDDTTTNTSKTPTAAQKRDSKATSTGKRNPEINRPAVTISVLNGTPTSGLAKLAGDALIKAGFTDTSTGNYNDTSPHPTSTVYYAAGSKLEAQEVAKELAIKDVQEAPEAVLAAGGSVPVIVILGADFENQ